MKFRTTLVSVGVATLVAGGGLLSAGPAYAAQCTVLTQQTPEFNTTSGVLTIPNVGPNTGDHYVYDSTSRNKPYKANQVVRLAVGQTATVDAVPGGKYCFDSRSQSHWQYTFNPAAAYGPQVAVTSKSVTGGAGQVSIAFHYSLVAPASAGKVIVIATGVGGAELYRETLLVDGSGNFSHTVKNVPVGDVSVSIQSSLNSGGSASETPDVVHSY